jgi:hypothetical protein
MLYFPISLISLSYLQENYWKRNVRENSCLRTGTLTDSKGFCENSGLGMEISGKTSRLYRGNVFQARKSLVSDIPDGEGKTAKPF